RGAGRHPVLARAGQEVRPHRDGAAHGAGAERARRPAPRDRDDARRAPQGRHRPGHQGPLHADLLRPARLPHGQRGGEGVTGCQTSEVSEDFGSLADAYRTTAWKLTIPLSPGSSLPPISQRRITDPASFACVVNVFGRSDRAVPGTNSSRPVRLSDRTTLVIGLPPTLVYFR